MTETARMYGGSLYDLAAEEGLEARILGELDEAVALFKANPDYLHLPVQRIWPGSDTQGVKCPPFSKR